MRCTQWILLSAVLALTGCTLPFGLETLPVTSADVQATDVSSDAMQIPLDASFDVPTDLPDAHPVDTSTCAAPLVACANTCVDTQSSTANCGTCAHACSTGQLCNAGMCTVHVCSGGLTLCGDACVNTRFDNANCGACNTICLPGQTCTAGTCAGMPMCASGLTLCGTACVNTMLDNANCGSCRNMCSGAEGCTGGACVVNCTAGTSRCGTACVNTQTDNANCGNCGTMCSTAAGESCMAGMCARCPTGTIRCGTTCANTQTDNANCGMCGTACAATTFGCGAGVCKTLRTLAWTETSTANPVTLTAMPVAGTPEVERLDYMAAGNQVYSPRTFTFSAMAVSTRTFGYSWQYNGFHAYFMASAGLQAFADGPGGRLTVDLVAPGTATNAGFMFSGMSMLNVNAGYAFGYIASGVNFDTDSRLLGTITITAN